MSDHYTYRVTWSAEDGEHVGLCLEFPSLSWLAPTLDEAFSGDAVSAQFASAITAFAKPTFENFRRMRHSAQYFDPDGPTITHDDAAWAISTARSAAEGTRRISEIGGLSRFELF